MSDEVIKKTKLSRRDVEKFDRLLAMSESPDQMERIIGRGRLREFTERFTKQALDVAAKKIGARPA